ncbi:MAG: hypothetical protein JWL71_4733 [Acidobacteria bacterium]|nr:hypothetical protein [Acidobacteriota bacterium]
MVRGAIAGALVAALGAAVIADSPPRVSFGVGVLRRDGLIVPFAAFDGRRWSSAWPAPSLELTIPIDVRGIPSRWWGPTPVLDSWQAWTGAPPATLRVRQPDWVNVHCVRQIALRSDYVAPVPAPPRTVQPYPKDGLAVSPPQAVERIAIVPLDSPEIRALIPAVHDAFNTAERQVEHQYGHPVARRAREGRAPDIEAVYAVGDRPRIYYVEAIRRYRLLGQASDDCAATAFGTGWFAGDGGQVRSLETSVDVLPCNRRGASFMLPLGAMRLAGKLYWLAQFAGFDHERYVVVEIKPKTVEAVLSVWGGSCSR